ncbi:MAG: type B 50S ribosomal protein L31 [bacterium]|jgi:large subunit ribosomal protein L31|nr:type B 50S ribosomal protein L31 [bacterium]
MKPDIHPDYHDVIFEDSSAKPPFRVKTRSTRTSDEKTTWEDGQTYPLIKVEISSASHPFFTGKMMLIDTAGMVERFRRRYGMKAAPQEAVAETAEKSEA